MEEMTILNRISECDQSGHLAIVVEMEQGRYSKWCPRCGKAVSEDTPGRIV